MRKELDAPRPPLILAPAGSKASFLAALAAGADAVYCGLKAFSARMEAQNFTLGELMALTRLAHDKGTRVYVALNALLKPDDMDLAGQLLEQLKRWVRPDALIIQDLSLVQLARQAGFSGELHLSTLANVSFAAALQTVYKNFGVNRVVLPRELNIDEIKALAQACPPDLDLEVFVHGALCYGVSGRCYWSSYFGGKSGLRGRCVQPCRRLYRQKEKTAKFFSCLDLSLDVLVKVLGSIPQVRVWKIEGRKKGPHYVFYTVKAYQMLRDHGSDPQMKKTALGLLAYALGRRGTHYNFLPQRPQNPIPADGETASGLFMGRTQGPKQKPYLVPRDEFLPGDVLRIGYEDESWHGTYRVGKYVPKKGRLYLKIASRSSPRKGTSVFLLDRRERELQELLSQLETELERIPGARIRPATFRARLPKKWGKKAFTSELFVYRKPGRINPGNLLGVWLTAEALVGGPRKAGARLWWWLPPVIWPEGEEELKGLVQLARKRGNRNFVLNAPWQVGLFEPSKGLRLWAGPFCNIANPLALGTLVDLGFSGVIVSPELGREDYFRLPQHSPLPLGIVISGNWPLCVSRVIAESLKPDQPFVSPKGEQGWVRKYGTDFWVYPNWKLDITGQKHALETAGYSLFVHLIEPLPRQVKLKKRPGLWNWAHGLR